MEGEQWSPRSTSARGWEFEDRNSEGRFYTLGHVRYRLERGHGALKIIPGRRLLSPLTRCLIGRCQRRFRAVGRRGSRRRCFRRRCPPCHSLGGWPRSWRDRHGSRSAGARNGVTPPFSTACPQTSRSDRPHEKTCAVCAGSQNGRNFPRIISRSSSPGMDITALRSWRGAP